MENFWSFAGFLGAARGWKGRGGGRGGWVVEESVNVLEECREGTPQEV
jgi:hypothetical protein